MIPLNEYDLRQITLIDNMVFLFENEKIGLFDLVNNLAWILNSLESVHNSWKDDFRTEINSLEMIQQSIDDGSISRWKGNFKEDIRNSIMDLKKMTSLLIRDYLAVSDPEISKSAIQAYANWFVCPICNDAWESNSQAAMVICPKCVSVSHNPRASRNKVNPSV